MTHLPPWARLLVRLATGAYRMALRRYPRVLRDRHGERMVEDVRHLLREEIERAGVVGWMQGCARVARDLLRPLPPRVEGPSGAARSARPGAGLEARAPQRSARVRAWADDLRAGWRSLRRRPGFALLLVGVLGVGLALNAVIFAVVDAYLLRPLPYPEAERLVEVRPATVAVGWRNSEDLFEKAVSWNLDGFTLVGDAGPEIVLGARVTADFFDVYGVHAALGRTFGADEGREGGPPVGVISHALWTRRFGADPDVLGRTVQVYPADEQDGLESFTIVGVLPRDFWYLNGYTDVLVPLRRPGPVYVARLRRGVPPDRAADVATVRARAAGALDTDDGRVRVRPLQEAYTASIRPQLLGLQGAGLLVLLAAAASAALLLLVRASGRTREMSVRRALGAGRGRLAAHLFSEAVLLAGGAGVLGVLLGRLAVGALGGVIEARLGRRVPGGTAALQLDASTIAAVVGAGALVAFVLGAISVVMAARGGIARGAAGGGRGGGVTGRAVRVRAALVATQVALCVALLGGGALLVRSALHLHAMRLGFEPERLEAFTVGLTTERADDLTRRAAFFGRLLQETEQLPGVAAAGLVRSVPYAGGLTARGVEVEARRQPEPLPEVVPQIASVSYFDALGVEAEVGRGFTSEDGPGTEPVAVVDASLAATIAPPGSPVDAVLGARIRFTAWTMPDMELEVGPWMTVVGVVPDVADGIGGTRPTLYVPYAQAPSAWMDLVVRRRPGGSDVTEAVRTLVRDLDVDTPVYAERDVAAAVRSARAPARFFAALLGGFALFSLVLALAGLYGVSAYAARQRHRDLAVRIALGATRGSVTWLFVRSTALTVGVGLVAGLAGARALGGTLRSQLHGVAAHDPATLAAVAGVVAATALLAVWIPARGAARLEVSRVLRDE